jgi:hypothetical protein
METTKIREVKSRELKPWLSKSAIKEFALKFYHEFTEKEAVRRVWLVIGGRLRNPELMIELIDHVTKTKISYAEKIKELDKISKKTGPTLDSGNRE